MRTVQLLAHEQRASAHVGRVVERMVDVLFVLVHGLGPVEVHLHGRTLHAIEVVRLLHVKLHGPVQHVLHLVCSQVRNVEARGFVDPSGDVRHRVHKAARRVNHWECAVQLGVHLGQAAGLVARGHEEEVAARHHLVLDLGVETHVATDAAAEAALRPPQGLGVLLLAVAHQDQLHVAGHAIARVLHQPTDDLPNDIHPLLPGEAPDKADEHCAWVLVQAHLVLQHGLVAALALFEVLHRVPPGNLLIDQGVPAVIHAVQDASEAQAVGLAAHDVLHAETAVHCLDLPSVVGGDGEDAVGADEARLGKVDAIPVDQVVRGLLLHAEEFARVHVGVLALVPEVVDDIDAACLVVAAVGPVLVAEVKGHQAGLPVIGQEEHLVTVGIAADVEDERRLHGSR
mmetsp:Transcript_86050/g.267367  ORF Transcript_86050/g.267367 Transcript_86050/m.267367 type:complete len:399 (+) Transcript_86050:183-1379(+)